MATTDLPTRNVQSKASLSATDKPALAEVRAFPQSKRTPPEPDRKTAKISVAGALPPARIPREALASPRQGGMLAIALAVSIALHLTAAAIHFSPFDFSRMADKEPPLEVALVNAKTATKPAKADILAQANLDGGGNTDEKRRAKTPLPVMPQETPNKAVAANTQPVETKREQRPDVMTQSASTTVIEAQPAPPETPQPTNAPTISDLMQKTLEAIRLEAQIAKDMDAYQKRPRRTFIGAQAQEYRFARYVEDWRMKVERVGNLNYPEAARQQKLYGSLLLTVSIRSDGSLLGVEVNRSSGKRILDAAAVKIVEMSAPFAAFPPDIKRDTDELHITRTWTFAKGDELTSTSQQ